jgi:hypothetical protein
LGEYSVNVVLVLDDVSDAELSCLGRAEWDVGVLCEFGAWVESEDESVVELEHGDSASGGIVAGVKLGPDHTGRAETEPIAVESERAFKVGHSEREDMDARFHRARLNMPSGDIPERWPRRGWPLGPLDPLPS